MWRVMLLSLILPLSLFLFCLSTFTHYITYCLNTKHVLPFNHVFSSLLFILKQNPRYPWAIFFNLPSTPSTPKLLSVQCICFVKFFGVFILVATHPFLWTFLLILVFYRCYQNRGFKSLFLGWPPIGCFYLMYICYSLFICNRGSSTCTLLIIVIKILDPLFVTLLFCHLQNKWQFSFSSSCFLCLFEQKRVLSTWHVFLKQRSIDNILS